MKGQTLADLAAPLLALQTAARVFSHLPAPTVRVSTIAPDRLDLTFHDDDFSPVAPLAAFEAWREALGIDAMDVVHRVHSDGRTGALSVHGVFAGAAVELVAYTDITALEPVPVEAGAGA
ncbi:hypothetical protein [Streptomyces laurentii]|uniref:hypothetical protein n=1 Tax=Streptomyces laurentii TaxID=39478 RepID=UPI0036ADBAF3